MLINMQRFGQRDVVAGEDDVVLAWPLPGECTLHNIWFECDVHYATGVANDQRTFYAMHGYAIPLLDPDAHQDIDTLWDTQIPKSTQDMSYELADGAVTGPVWEPGELLTESITQIQLSKPELVFKRKKMLSFQKSPTLVSTTWHPGDNFTTQVRKNIYADRESAVMLGLSSPNQDQDSADLELLPSAATAEWAMLRYIVPVLEDMMVHILGLGAVGSGNVPYDDAENFIEDLVSDFNDVDDASAFSPDPFSALAFGTAQINVPGEMPKIALSAE